MRSSTGENRKRPRIEVVDDDLMIYFRLAKEGYGSVREIEQWDARKVIQAINYEKFCGDYEAAYMEVNK